MANIFSTIGKRNLVDVTTGIARVGITALGSVVTGKALKTSVDSYINVLGNVRNSIRNN